ncbi:Serine/threonine-protein phosphatase PP1-1 [Aduncisulcus paluster]|uniref:Serine/threonine-protein phosphatase n=1 Tax=Aduncisulcus paluster TaxID=2918883 RepID=A0ABQ5K6K6_9EUKA|nr:Serine/threonine-protein phosphatase PP1-1 [Aduncisulcus paluster]
MVNYLELLDKATRKDQIPHADFKSLCYKAIEILGEECNVITVPAPTCIVGDIHGQFYDLKRLFEISGGCPRSSYVFLGDFVDRGYYSLEVVTLLLCLKVLYPSRIFLIRGNHECRMTTHTYGFYEECVRKHGSPDIWRAIMQVFDHFPIAAIVDSSILCVHGGPSPKAECIDDIRIINRAKEIPSDGTFADLVWSDPSTSIMEYQRSPRGAGYHFGKDAVRPECIDDIRIINRAKEIPSDGTFADLVWSDPSTSIMEYQRSPRGAGYHFGKDAVRRFLYTNDITLIARAHQLMYRGFAYHFPEHSVVTVWSAPNYTYRCENYAAVMRVNEDQTHSFVQFAAMEESGRKRPKNVSYPMF